MMLSKNVVMKYKMHHGKTQLNNFKSVLTSINVRPTITLKRNFRKHLQTTRDPAEKIYSTKLVHRLKNY